MCFGDARANHMFSFHLHFTLTQVHLALHSISAITLNKSKLVGLFLQLGRTRDQIVTVIKGTLCMDYSHLVVQLYISFKQIVLAFSNVRCNPVAILLLAVCAKNLWQHVIQYYLVKFSFGWWGTLFQFISVSMYE